MNNPYAFNFRAFFNFKIVTLFTVFLFSTATFAADGKDIFKKNCAVCHNLDKSMSTGPGLEGIKGRAPSDEWLFKWIKNNKALIKSGDAYANNMFNANGNKDMTIFDGVLSDDDIKAVITFIKDPPVEQKKVVDTKDETVKEPGTDLNWTLVLVGIVVFLAIIATVLRSTRIQLQKVADEKAGIEPTEDKGFFGEIRNWMQHKKRWVALGILIFVAWFLQWGWYALKDIGVYGGEKHEHYRPEQPIKFSHKIHAGDNAINCQYCHFTVEKSRHAGIPPVTVCMNCHKGIKEGSITGKTEIAKIYEAAGWDVDKQQYSNPQKPIKWVKVHNLQDFVFFSHQQHVTVGKQECATCHGDLKEMTVAEQVQPLTMGWCVDCHRKTEVAGMKKGTDGAIANPYYEDLHKKLAEKYKGQKEKITVDQIGGIECAKCHY